MTDSKQTKQGLPWVRLALSLLIAIAFTILCVETSKKIGRLSTAPNYDDIVYIKEGTRYANYLSTNGLQGLASFYSRHGMHSPFSVTTATASLSILGRKSTSPYYGNIIIALTALFYTAYCFHKARLIDWIAFSCLLLATPFMIMGIVEFRPDIYWALVLGIGLTYTIASEPNKHYVINYLIGGTAFGACLLIKPPTFAMTLLIAGYALVARIILKFNNSNIKVKAPMECGIGALVFITSLVVTALPHWYNNHRKIIEYFTTNAFGINKEVWAYKATSAQQFLFYVTGQGYASNIKYTGAAILGILALLYLKCETDKKFKAKLLLLCGGPLIAYIINSVTPIKSPFLGGAIYGPLLAISIYGIGKLLSKKNAPAYANLITISSIVIILTLTRWPEYSNWGANPTLAKINSEANELVIKTLDIAASPKSILFLQGGPITHEYISMWFMNNEKSCEMKSAAFNRNKELTILELEKSEWVITQSPGMTGSPQFLPIEKSLDDINAYLINSPKHILMAVKTMADGKSIMIYKTTISQQ